MGANNFQAGQEVNTDEDKAPEEPKIKYVPKRITCPRCNGDGVWHTSATGVRLERITGPLVDTSKVCPECKGKKKVTIQITEAQAIREREARSAKRKADAAARNAQSAADKAKAAAEKRNK